MHPRGLSEIAQGTGSSFKFEVIARLSNSRVDVHIDNCVLKSAHDGDGCKNSAVNDVVKNIFRDSRDFNSSIQTFYVQSSRNPVDESSRDLSDLDCMLTP